ncbi:MAG: hypothetical protein PVI23_01010 [Maricaulaceae bacterium]|jgi:hypothetical protein
MKKLLVSTAFAAALIGAPAIADHHEGVAGTWSVSSAQASSTMTITEADDGYAITYESDSGDSAISDVAVDGNHVTFKRAFEAAGAGELTLNYDIMIDGDSLTGTASAEGELAAAVGEIELTGSRADMMMDDEDAAETE